MNKAELARHIEGICPEYKVRTGESACVLDPRHIRMIIDACEPYYREITWLDKNQLKKCKQYLLMAHNNAEARHDSPDSDTYMDGVQYEIMQETDELIKAIDDAMGGE